MGAQGMKWAYLEMLKPLGELETLSGGEGSSGCSELVEAYLQQQAGVCCMVVMATPTHTHHARAHVPTPKSSHTQGLGSTPEWATDLYTVGLTQWSSEVDSAGGW